MTTFIKRLIGTLAIVLPAAALVSSPVLAANHAKTRTHHASIHKASSHKGHAKKIAAPTAS